MERVEGRSPVSVSWLSRLTSRRVDPTRLHVFAFPGNFKNRKLKVSIKIYFVRKHAGTENFSKSAHAADYDPH